MKLFTFSLFAIALFFTFGCGDDKFNSILDNLDRPTYEVADEIAQCYNHLETDLTGYYLAFDRLCLDMLVTGKTLEELAVDTTVDDILADIDTYQAEYVEIEAYVIFKNDDGILIADTNNDLTDKYLVIVEQDTEYIGTLTQGSQYTFILQVFSSETTNGGLLLDEPVAVENE